MKLPSPVKAQKYRAAYLYEGDVNDKAGQSIYNCDKEGEPNYRVSWFVRLWHIIRHLAVWMLGFGLMWLALRIGDGQISETMQITLHYFMDGSEAKNVGGEHDLPPNGGYSLRRPGAACGGLGRLGVFWGGLGRPGVAWATCGGLRRPGAT